MLDRHQRGPQVGEQTTPEAGRERPGWGQAHGGRPGLRPGSLTSRLSPLSFWRGPAGSGAAHDAAPIAVAQVTRAVRDRLSGSPIERRVLPSALVDESRTDGERSSDEAFAPPFARIGALGGPHQRREVLIRMR